MRALRLLISLLLLATLGACAAPAQPPRWRPEALVSLQHAAAVHADRFYANEYESAQNALLQGEEFLMEGEKEEAEKYFLLAWQKADMVQEKARAESRRQEEEAARQAEERRLAEEKKRIAALEKEKERRAAERLLQEKAAAQAARDAAEAARKKPKPVKERLVNSYTVRRGESLPLIAAQAEVYNDRNLWPLLYRANRDQISDPRHIWPGQVLRVPRNSGRDDINEARRYAQEKPLH